MHNLSAGLKSSVKLQERSPESRGRGRQSEMMKPNKWAIKVKAVPTRLLRSRVHLENTLEIGKSTRPYHFKNKYREKLRLMRLT